MGMCSEPQTGSEPLPEVVSVELLQSISKVHAIAGPEQQAVFEWAGHRVLQKLENRYMQQLSIANKIVQCIYNY